MQKRTQRMRTTSSLSRWFLGSICGSGLILVGMCLFYFTKPSSGDPLVSQEANFNNEIKPNNTALQPKNTEPLVAEINTDSTSPLTTSMGSVEEACELHKLPSYWDWDQFGEDSDKEDPLASLLASEECRTALDTHVSAINPYRWGQTFVDLQFEFIVLDNPLTFERIFSDPSGDFARVQDAMSRTECLLEQGTIKNFELKESCNADALLNYALMNRFCYYGMVNAPLQKDNWEDHSPKQSRLNWQHALEGRWLKMKCQKIDPQQRLSVHKHPDLVKLLSSLETTGTFSLNLLRTRGSSQPEGTYSETLPTTHLITNLIEMAARLGDDAAGLTRKRLGDEGMKYGRFSAMFYVPAWSNLQTKREPSRTRLLQTFELLWTFTNLDVEIKWDRVVRHLCEPPFTKVEYPRTYQNNSEEPEEPIKPKSCRTVVNELYIDGELSEFELEFIDRFERVALKLDLYD